MKKVFGSVTVETTIKSERRVSVIATEGKTRLAFDVDYNAHLPSGHPSRYQGLPRDFAPPVREMFKVAVRSAFAA